MEDWGHCEENKEVKQGHLIEIFDFHLEDVRLVNFI